MSGDGVAASAAPGTSGDGGAPAPTRRGASALKLVVKNGFLEAVDVKPDIPRSRSDGDLCRSSVGRPSRASNVASLAPSLASLPSPPREASTSIQDSQGSVGYPSRESNVASLAPSRAPPPNTRRTASSPIQDGQGLGGASLGGEHDSPRAGTAACQGEPASLTAFPGRAAGSDLEGRSGTAARGGELTGLAAFNGHGVGIGSEGRGTRHSGQAVDLAPHPLRKRSRPSKATRAECKKLAQKISRSECQQGGVEGQVGLDSEACLAGMGITCVAQQRYMRSILTAKGRLPSVQQAGVVDKPPARTTGRD